LRKGGHAIKEGVDGTIKCNNKTFGDPLVGVGKQCVCFSTKNSLASQFAAGFFFGIHAGGYKIDDLDKCLRREMKATSLFKMGLNEITEALKEDSQPESHGWGQQEAVRALREMAKFIYEMATEKENMKYICPDLEHTFDISTSS
jgi:hypothetical protein